MHVTSDDARERLKHRLVRIEGQVRGIQRMLDEDRDCRDVVQQLGAVRAAIHQVGLEVLRTYATQCLDVPDGAAVPDEADGARGARDARDAHDPRGEGGEGGEGGESGKGGTERGARDSERADARQEALDYVIDVLGRWS